MNRHRSVSSACNSIIFKKIEPHLSLSQRSMNADPTKLPRNCHEIAKKAREYTTVLCRRQEHVKKRSRSEPKPRVPGGTKRANQPVLVYLLLLVALLLVVPEAPIWGIRHADTTSHSARRTEQRDVDHVARHCGDERRKISQKLMSKSLHRSQVRHTITSM